MAAPQPLTMDRLDEQNELILAQSTSQCCRCGIWQPSINWVVAEGNNFTPGSNPFDLDSVGWIHEESSFLGRCLSGCAAGFRGIKYVQHSGPPPASIVKENNNWFCCQTGAIPNGMSEQERNSNVVVTHEKNQTCGVFCCWLPCVCNGCLPYLETKDGATGRVIGKTSYVCDLCCFVPKYDVVDGSGKKMYHLRPDTCFAGCCVMCRCDGGKGKCCRIPFIVRDPETLEPVLSGATEAGKAVNAMIDLLWAGLKNECCSQKNAYHVAFPANMTAEEKTVLMGSSLLVDVTMFEQDNDN
mmetsp:Transcript_22877/g.48668  ORF Transcript_22877/g.48668 Transcript_22877/m.48668 type:complete len:298 (+) Transcript_22877:113-1006(+)|eukprot:CAMPEP_0201124130 /NCGR_PEP_ID=MMETSP0850-20130426/10575_1 /ASSEMBLY_ACC=CAM_ASM_000622 /TAXON_ID=183588 /ORGANISM="Pseudo-nitzschia fraudulenta, Strain WWA7" /LENGTH=297 /DNA_ID=CAMNT_0047391323 /DNA_START=102 /DNA_END=995 /DNA_ORIENTATION=-